MTGRKYYVINEPQAEIIRLIYSMYLDGYGEKAIVNELTRVVARTDVVK